MKEAILDEKLRDLTDTISVLLVKNDGNIDDIHILRKETRELLSLVDTTDPFYPKLRKIIKLSNTIRNTDVFFSNYIESLKPTYKKSLDMNTLIINSEKNRAKLLSKLYLYLQNINIPLTVKYKDTTTPLGLKRFLETETLNFEQKTLHKYRIAVKNTLYTLKNNNKQKIKKIKTLTALKDLLGNINDNFNGLNKLRELQGVNTKLFKKIEKYTLEKNMKYFHKVQKLRDRL